MDIAVKNLLFDSALGKEMYDGNQKISIIESDEKIAQLCYEYTGLTKDSSKKQIKRALETEKGREFFEVIEEAIELKVQTGMKENEFFNEFVDRRNLKDGDENSFWVDDPEIILNVAKVSGDNHDLITQKLGEGNAYSVPMSWYGIKVGSDIRLFLTGRKNWSDFINAVSRAYIKAFQQEVYAEFTNSVSKLPVPEPFIGNGELNDASKEDFDEIIENVEVSNDGVPVVIMGTKVALKKLDGLVKIDWIANSQKESVATTGILGSYETSKLLEIPQRFADNDLTRKLIDNTKLYIMPVVADNKFIKYVESGEVEVEITEQGRTQNDQQTYDVQREMGVATVITRNFGVWTIE